MKKLLALSVTLFSMSLMLIACQPKDEGSKDQEITYARQAYDRCVQGRGADTCNVVRASSVMSVREFYGNTNAYNNTGWNTGWNNGINSFGMQYSVDQMNNYFNTYLRRASKEEIIQMANQWTNSWGPMNSFINPAANPSRCNAYGCF